MSVSKHPVRAGPCSSMSVRACNPVTLVATCRLLLALVTGSAANEITVTRLPDENPRVLGGKAHGVIDAPIERVWEILNDFNCYAEFLPRQVKSWVLRPEAVREMRLSSSLKPAQAEALLKRYRTSVCAGDTIYTYNLLDMPFPVSQRWYVLALVRDPDEYLLRWEQVAGSLVSTTGSWHLRAQGRKTVATYTTCSDVGLQVPGFLISLGLKQTLPDIIRALRQRTEELSP